MKRAMIAVALAMACLQPQAAEAASARLQRDVRKFLTAWTGGPIIDRAAVARFYAPHVVYYGRAETRAQVLMDKRALARRWPERIYRLAPGSASAHCSRDQTRCEVLAVLDWRAESPQRSARSKGIATVKLDLVRRGAVLKIVRETGKIVARSQG